MSVCRKCGGPLSADGVCARCLLDTGIAGDAQSLAERLFQAALAHAECDRAGFVESVAAGDAALLAEVQMLLDGYAEAGGDAALPTLGQGDAREQWASHLPETEGSVIGHFRLVRKIGQGGMGTVWEAGQDAPIRRRVALKIIKLGMDTVEVVQRFERERRTVALMSHPHIAQVFEAGATPQGRPYFAMELVDGEPITTHCSCAELSVRERLSLFLNVCGAVEHAHQKGIIHRDLKPSNILVSEGLVKVIDFGIAKATLDTGDSGFTRQSQVLGTPAYMSPEQAESEGVDVDTRTDVYSLGVVLYELLSGELPFDPRRFASTGMKEVQRILREEEPPRPSTRLAAVKSTPPLPVKHLDVRGDLDWIILKALSKDRTRRYASAAAFADDLRRYLGGETVSAVPPTAAYRFGKFIRRHRAAVAAVSSVVLALSGGLVMSLIQVQRTNDALAGEARARAEATFTVADLYTRSGLAAAEAGGSTRAALWFTNAAIIAAQDPARADSNRMRAATWTAESRIPVSAFETGLPHIENIAFHPNGKAVILTAINGTGAQLWDLETEIQSPLTAAGAGSASWDAAGKFLCVSRGGKVTVVDYTSGEVLAERDGAGMVALHPGGGEVAISEPEPCLWDWKTGTVRPAASVAGGIKRIRWSPDGKFLLWQSMDRVSVCAAAQPELPLATPLPNNPRALADFSGGEGQFFHSVPGGSSFIRTASGQVVSEISEGEYALATSPGGTLMARAHAPLWQAGGSRRQIPQHSRNNIMESASFSPDGQILATAAYDATVRLWSTATDQPLGQAGWHQHPVQCVAFSPDGKLIASSQIGLVRIWKLEDTARAASIPAAVGSLATLSGDGRYLAPSGVTQLNASLRRTRVYQVSDAQPAGPELSSAGTILSAAFSPDTAWLAMAVSTVADRSHHDWENDGGSGQLEVWDWRTGKPLLPAVPLPAEPRDVAIHPSGEWIAIYCSGGQIVEWERKTGSLRPLFASHRRSSPSHTLTNGRCAYADGGRVIVTWGELDSFHLFDRVTGQEFTPPGLGGDTLIYGAAFHGSTAAMLPAGPSAPLASVLDLRNGQIAAGLPHSDWLYHGQFDETGRYFLTTGRRPFVQVWDWKQGTLTGPALPHATDVMAATFVPGTPWVLTGSHDGYIRCWDRRSGMPVRPPFSIPGAPGSLILQLTLTPGSDKLIAAGFLSNGTVSMFNLEHILPPVKRPASADEERLSAEINAGAWIHESGGLVPLTGEAWLTRWQELRRRFPARNRLAPSRATRVPGGG